MPHANRSKTNRRVDSNPTAAEIKAARERAGLTPEEAAKLVHSTVTAWKEWEDPDHPRRMHPGLWELFQIKTRREPGATVIDWRTGQPPLSDPE